MICDAIATPFKVIRHASIKTQDTVAIIGAGGGLGIHMIMMAKWANSKVIAVDVASNKFDACKQVGADVYVLIQETTTTIRHFMTIQKEWGLMSS